MPNVRRRKQFTFYASYIDNVMKLPKCRRFETLLAIIYYALDGLEPELTGSSDAVFGAVRPNIDSSRVKAEKLLRERERAEAENDPMPEPSPAEVRTDKNEKENKKKNKSEKETKTETETKAANDKFTAALARRPAGEWEEPEDEPERTPPYAEMLTGDYALRCFWKSLLDHHWEKPLTAEERRRLLRILHAAPGDERMGILAGYMMDRPEGGGPEAKSSGAVRTGV